ncbi:MAG: GIY-YIG nuclease family protein [Longimicrobiaceae bacterium]
MSPAQVSGGTRRIYNRGHDTAFEAHPLPTPTAVRSFYIYILSNASRTLYVGVTNDLVRRVWEHRQGAKPGFTAKYHVTQLVWFEETVNVAAAIAREKQIKGWKREKKIALVSATNPQWRDLAEEEGFFTSIR